MLFAAANAFMQDIHAAAIATSLHPGESNERPTAMDSSECKDAEQLPRKSWHTILAGLIDKSKTLRMKDV